MLRLLPGEPVRSPRHGQPDVLQCHQRQLWPQARSTSSDDLQADASLFQLAWSGKLTYSMKSEVKKVSKLIFFNTKLVNSHFIS
jgi:hypothetical protein